MVVIFDDADMELARQQQDGEEREQRHRQEVGNRQGLVDGVARLGVVERAGQKVPGSVEHPERHEDADGEECE